MKSPGRMRYLRLRLFLEEQRLAMQHSRIHKVKSFSQINSDRGVIWGQVGRDQHGANSPQSIKAQCSQELVKSASAGPACSTGAEP